jgi:hypothetical protein
MKSLWIFFRLLPSFCGCIIPMIIMLSDIILLGHRVSLWKSVSVKNANVLGRFLRQKKGIGNCSSDPQSRLSFLAVSFHSNVKKSFLLSKKWNNKKSHLFFLKKKRRHKHFWEMQISVVPHERSLAGVNSNYLFFKTFLIDKHFMTITQWHLTFHTKSISLDSYWNFSHFTKFCWLVLKRY